MWIPYNVKIYKHIVFISSISACFPVQAYLDPGTGSMLLSFFIGILSSAYFGIRKIPEIFSKIGYRYKIKELKNTRNYIVIYCESSAYTNTFKPILREFCNRNESVLYLSSDQKDANLNESYPDNILTKYIGKGNKAYSLLNFLSAKALVLTTPGIGTLQIKRSKGVSRYIHVVHSVGDIHLYKYFAFDYYDTVIVNGDYQKKAIEYLEKYRNTPAKRVLVLGIPYFDILCDKCSKLVNKSCECDSTILLAPTWGRNGMLSRLGSSVLTTLADTGYKIIFRPHPQSYISEKELLARIENEIKQYNNIIWDKSPDGFSSMNNSSILVSDLSGIVFDYAFCFLRPVITISYEVNRDGFEAFDLPWQMTDIILSEKIGYRIMPESISKIPDLVTEMINDKSFQQRIIEIRNKTIANFGCCSKSVVDEICNSAKGV